MELQIVPLVIVLAYLVGMLLSNEKILSRMGNKMNEGMLAPYRTMFLKMDREIADGRQK